ncbi:SAYSVFN motif domain containing 1 [Cochliomyia hominivorax]
MENIEDKLKSYRIRKRRQEQLQSFKKSLKDFFMLGVKDKNEILDKTKINIPDSKFDAPESVIKSDFEEDNDVDSIISSEEDDCKSLVIESDMSDGVVLKYTIRIVYVAFWVTLYIIAIELQFGIVFLMFSALAGIYLNTRTGPKKRNEISAYSVFNKNCESIDGTLKAEQFEREIGIR